MDYSSIGANQALEKVGSTSAGLNEAKVLKSRERFGTNELDKAKKITLISRFFRQFKNLMVIVLLISAVISVVMALVKHEYGDLFEGGIIFFIVIINAIIGVFQEKKAEDSLALLAQKTGTHATVIRNGKPVKVETKEVVVGDIVVLRAGDFVPADVRLIETSNLKCDESSLTGESHAVFKDAGVVCKVGTPLADQQNMCFSGTMVTYGKGMGVVISVGKETQMGKIAKILNKEIKEKSPLEKNIDRIGKVITIGVLAIVAIVFVIELLFSAKLDVLDAFLIAIALAVAAIPESLPAVITIIMALGVERLAKRGAIVKVLGAVETLGCCNVICSDKTGTLTQNNMQVKHIYTSGKLYTTDEFSYAKHEEIVRAVVLCNNAKLNEQGKPVGDATETSLINFCLDKNIKIDEINNTFKRIDELPFDSTRKTMTTINEDFHGTCIYSKGAYDYLIGSCSHYLHNGEILPLTDSVKKEIEKTHKQLGSFAERVIAVTMKRVDKANNAYKETSKTGEESKTQSTNAILQKPQNINQFDEVGANTGKNSMLQKTQNESKFDEKMLKNEQNMVFLGLFGIIDPPRPQVKNSIANCHKAGLRPIMITGDHPHTAFAVAKEIGIAKTEREVITGGEIAQMSKKELKEKIGSFSVFCRVTPEDKVKIVKALKGSGRVVAMSGDGVNDAPSLKMADIGISMGSGTDVTKSVADLILTNDDFSTIVIAIEEGRTIFANIQKTLQFLISTNAVEVLGIFITALLIKNAVFLLPSQILFINLITDSLPAFALGLEPPEKDVMSRPPRNGRESIFSGEVGTAIIYQAFVQTLIVLVMFVVCNAKLGNEVASTMVFLTICFMQILHAVNCKTNKSLAKINVFANKTFNLSFLALFALILAVGTIPFLQTAFNIVALNAIEWLIVALSSLSIIPAVELCKFIVHKFEKPESEKVLVISEDKKHKHHKLKQALQKFYKSKNAKTSTKTAKSK